MYMNSFLFFLNSTNLYIIVILNAIRTNTLNNSQCGVAVMKSGNLTLGLVIVAKFFVVSLLSSNDIPLFSPLFKHTLTNVLATAYVCVIWTDYSCFRAFVWKSIEIIIGTYLFKEKIHKLYSNQFFMGHIKDDNEIFLGPSKRKRIYA